MSGNNGMYKAFTVRRFRVDLHYRLKLLALSKKVSMEEMFNDVMAAGLTVCEKRAPMSQMQK